MVQVVLKTCMVFHRIMREVRSRPRRTPQTIKRCLTRVILCQGVNFRGSQLTWHAAQSGGVVSVYM